MRKQLWRIVSLLPVLPRLHPPWVVLAGDAVLVLGLVIGGFVMDGLVNDITIVLSIPVLSAAPIAALRHRTLAGWPGFTVTLIGAFCLLIQVFLLMASVEHAGDHGGLMLLGDVYFLNIYGLASLLVTLGGVLAVLRPRQ